MARVSRKRRQRDAAPNGNCGCGTKVYKTALYIRLSVEDIRKKVSNSVGTQKAMLTDYLQTRPDMKLCGVYEDVNYTGTNFNRPAFAKMMADIQTGSVNCVIVKDLSRFSRCFEETGHILERVFPSLQVRFIALDDFYDSLTASPDENGLTVPLKNLINEIYARDISRKTQSGKRAKQQRGEFCGSFAPYGYIKSGSSFALDEETVPVVRLIFGQILNGKSDIAIAQSLNDLKVLPPSRYRFEKGIVKDKKFAEMRFWHKSAIKRISENPVYTGVLVTGKYQSHFLRGGGITEKDRGEWLLFEGAHPAIIDKDTYDKVRKIREKRKG
jgi:DNA invertase Pin-like site-specific DNA recombinase